MINPGTLVEIIKAHDQSLKEKRHIGKHGIVIERVWREKFSNLGFYKVLLTDQTFEIFHYRDLKQLSKT